MSSFDLVTMFSAHSLRLSFEFHQKSRSSTFLLKLLLNKHHEVSKQAAAASITASDPLRKLNEASGSRNLSAALQVINCPFRSLSQFVLPEWKPNPPWSDAHHPPDAAVPFKPRTATPFTRSVSCAGLPELHRHAPPLHAQLLTPVVVHIVSSMRRPRCTNWSGECDAAEEQLDSSVRS